MEPACRLVESDFVIDAMRQGAPEHPGKEGCSFANSVNKDSEWGRSEAGITSGLAVLLNSGWSKAGIN